MDMHAVSTLAVDVITLDGDLQPRAQIDLATVQEYAQLMADGRQFPPVVVFHDGSIYWLADGYHRVHAMRASGIATAECIVRQGSKTDGVAYSLHANAEHGKQRDSSDYRKAYEIGCRYSLFGADDSKAVAAALGCSLRWADRLTETARERARQERDAEMARREAAGESTREIAKAVGLDQSTVVRRLADAKANSAEMHRPETLALTNALGLPPDLPPRIKPDATRAILAESRARSDVLFPVGRALEAFASLPSVDAVLRADPDRKWSDINEFMPIAAAWINELKEKWNE